jgi:ubiquinone/menaquinone biosynthesis C-methylase UbiE
MMRVPGAEREQSRGRVRALHGAARSTAFADRSFDLVLCQFAMMFFADRRAAAAEMRRVLTG